MSNFSRDIFIYGLILISKFCRGLPGRKFMHKGVSFWAHLNFFAIDMKPKRLRRVIKLKGLKNFELWKGLDSVSPTSKLISISNYTSPGKIKKDFLSAYNFYFFFGWYEFSTKCQQFFPASSCEIYFTVHLKTHNNFVDFERNTRLKKILSDFTRYGDLPNYGYSTSQLWAAICSF